MTLFFHSVVGSLVLELRESSIDLLLVRLQEEMGGWSQSDSSSLPLCPDRFHGCVGDKILKSAWVSVSSYCEFVIHKLAYHLLYYLNAKRIILS